jgi:hypothetical protein
MRVFDACAGYLGEPTEEMGPCRWELITSNEPTVFAKSLLYVVVVENGQSDGCLPNSTCADESDRYETVRKLNDFFQSVHRVQTGPSAGAVVILHG